MTEKKAFEFFEEEIKQDYAEIIDQLKLTRAMLVAKFPHYQDLADIGKAKIHIEMALALVKQGFRERPQVPALLHEKTGTD